MSEHLNRSTDVHFLVELAYQNFANINNKSLEVVINKLKNLNDQLNEKMEMQEFKEATILLMPIMNLIDDDKISREEQVLKEKEQEFIGTRKHFDKIDDIFNPPTHPTAQKLKAQANKDRPQLISEQEKGELTSQEFDRLDIQPAMIEDSLNVFDDFLLCLGKVYVGIKNESTLTDRDWEFKGGYERVSMVIKKASMTLDKYQSERGIGQALEELQAQPPDTKLSNTYVQRDDQGSTIRALRSLPAGDAVSREREER